MTYTGGPLNELNGKMGISAPQNSVPVMKLIRKHHPKSKEELVALIQFHYEQDCPCGIKSKGTVVDFGKNLFHAQLNYWGENRFTLKQCIQWEYDLFVVQSLKGGKIEKLAMKAFQTKFPQYQVKEAIGFLDEELRIDLVIGQNNQSICGIQVKPATFLRMRNEVITFNHKANKKWKKPVYYLFYNEKEEFENLEELVLLIENLPRLIKP